MGKAGDNHPGDDLGTGLLDDIEEVSREGLVVMVCMMMRRSNVERLTVANSDFVNIGHARIPPPIAEREWHRATFLSKMVHHHSHLSVT